jgi:predicted nucleotidyltransferase
MENVIRKQLLESIPGLNAVYLFGSFASGDENKDSDIDIGILAAADLDRLTLFETAQQLSAKLNRDVDLLDIKKVSLVMQFQIISKGKIIYAKHPVELLDYETLITSMYQRFNEERKFIINEVINSGRVLS